MLDRVSTAMKEAMKSGAKDRLSTLRLMLAALKDRELGIGTGGQTAPGPLTEADAVQVFQKMVKQRRDSIDTYIQGSRKDLADKEAAEIVVIEEFLPRQMDEAGLRAAVAAAIAESGAAGPKDMGKVMGVLKSKHAGALDMGKASAIVKELLK